MKRLSVIDPELTKIREERKKISSELDIVKRIIGDKEEKIQDVKEKSNAIREQKADVRSKADVISKEVDEANEKLRNAYQTKDKMRESYYKQLYEFELQNDKVRYIKGLVNQQKKIKATANEREDRIAAKRAEIQNRPNPYQKEIDTCESLVQYCHKLKVQQGLVPQNSEQVAKDTEKEMINQYNRQDLDQKLKDGKIQMAVKQADTIVVNKKKGKKPKAQNKANDAPKTFNIDFAVINKFGLVHVSPPISPEDLDHKITELQDKQKRYERDGNEELNKEKADIEQNVEKMVEEDIEAEIKAAAEEENSEEEEEKTEKKPQPKKAGIKKPKDEFFDGSDSEEDNQLTSGAYAKPSRGGGQPANRGARRGGRGGRQGNAAFDDEDFPTL